MEELNSFQGRVLYDIEGVCGSFELRCVRKVQPSRSSKAIGSSVHVDVRFYPADIDFECLRTGRIVGYTFGG